MFGIYAQGMNGLEEYRQIKDSFVLEVPERFNYTLDVVGEAGPGAA